jgi:hypothetical protein
MKVSILLDRNVCEYYESIFFFWGGAFWMVDMRNITAKMSLCHSSGDCLSNRQESCLDSGYKDGGDLLVLRVSELEKCSNTM